MDITGNEPIVGSPRWRVGHGAGTVALQFDRPVESIAFTPDQLVNLLTQLTIHYGEAQAALVQRALGGEREPS